MKAYPSNFTVISLTDDDIHREFLLKDGTTVKLYQLRDGEYWGTLSKPHKNGWTEGYWLPNGKKANPARWGEGYHMSKRL